MSVCQVSQITASMVGRAVAEAAPRNGLANADLLHVCLNTYVTFEANYYRSVLFCINTSQCPSLNQSEARAAVKGKPPVTPPNTLCSQSLNYHNNFTNATTQANRWLPTHCVCSGLALISVSGETSLLCWHFLWMFKQEPPPLPVRSRCWWCLGSLNIITCVTFTTALALFHISQVETESGRN